MFRLVLLFVALPAIELYLLLLIATRVGPLPTLALIVVTGMLGATLARGQGLRVLGEIRQEMDAGRLPGAALVDGVLVLIAAAVLLTPGILTDAFGFLCLVPATRTRIRRALLRRLERAVADGRLHAEIRVEDLRGPSRERPMKDITPPRGPDDR